MFGIIILLETIPAIWIRGLRVRQQHITKNFINVKFFLHNAAEDQDWRCTSGRYSGPNVNFKGVLSLWFQLGWSVVFSKADLPKTLQPYSTLVCEDDIFKFLVALQTLLTEGKARDTVCLSDHLAIARATFFQPSFLLFLLMEAVDRWTPFSLYSSFCRPKSKIQNAFELFVD